MCLKTIKAFFWGLQDEHHFFYPMKWEPENQELTRTIQELLIVSDNLWLLHYIVIPLQYQWDSFSSLIPRRKEFSAGCNVFVFFCFVEAQKQLKVSVLEKLFAENNLLAEERKERTQVQRRSSPAEIFHLHHSSSAVTRWWTMKDTRFDFWTSSLEHFSICFVFLFLWVDQWFLLFIFSKKEKQILTNRCQRSRFWSRCRSF